MWRAMSGFIPMSIAQVAPVGRKDLAEYSLVGRPAAAMALLKMVEIVDESTALYGLLSVRITGLSGID